MVLRNGPYGNFYSCSDPDCRKTLTIAQYRGLMNYIAEQKTSPKQRNKKQAKKRIDWRLEEKKARAALDAAASPQGRNLECQQKARKV